TNLDAGFSGFNGLTHRDSRLADNGNQFSVEPPDQGLAVGAGFVVEVVNKAVAAYDTNGNLLAGPTALNPFFGATSAIVRGTPNVFGPFFSDPKAYFDPAENRFFVTIAEQDVDTATGQPLPHTEVRIAVSQTADPTGDWTIFALDVTNDGDGVYGSCPCFGDQPLIGADRYGFYINTNAYNFDVEGPFVFFRGTNLYAISKHALATATGPSV